MGKSIYQQLIDGAITVDHNGETLTDVTLPEWMAEIGSILAKGLPSDEEEMAITDCLAEHEVFEGFLAMGLQQSLVALRAVIRPTDIAHGKLKGETVKVSILADESANRQRAVDFIPNPLPRPKDSKPITKDAALKAIKASGLSKEEILAAYK